MTYIIIDIHTGIARYSHGFADKRVAEMVADMLDADYGAMRYLVREKE